ncbi:MAG: adenine deaminase [Lentimicrobium sp.]|jgi:adenine deaminase|nr:adenine deaminase [Lentimicrobium sp.]
MEDHRFSVSGQIVDVISGTVFPGRIEVVGNKIQKVIKTDTTETRLIVPGLIDAHVHIESSMLLPSEFARLAVVHGTTATVSDPHEIANVLGMEGVKFMINNGKKVNFRFYFGAPSCVPATSFETSGACLGPKEVEEMLSWPEIYYLSEMMNFPGVLYGDAEVASKLDLAKKYNKPVDGHAPGILGEEARRYAEAGITTDHECFTTDEAKDKIEAGMKVLIREGSAAKNFDALIELLEDHPDMIMFCSDDKHPDDLVSGHINVLVKRAIAAGYNFMDVIRACTQNPTKHYNLKPALLREGHFADFIVVDNPANFNVLQVYIDGIKVAENGNSLIDHVQEETPNQFNALSLTPEMLKVKAMATGIRVQQAIEGQLITKERIIEATVIDDCVVSDTKRDILKMMVMNRYYPAWPAVNFVSGFGLTKGAIASTVAHDSHNIIAVGVDDESIALAVNALEKVRGGIAVVNGVQVDILPLPVAGIMSADDGYEVARRYSELNKLVRNLGTSLNAPYMTLSFMALLVIPALKLSDKGLFDGNNFKFTELFENNRLD